MTIDEFRKKYGPRFGMSDRREVDAIIDAKIARFTDLYWDGPPGWACEPNLQIKIRVVPNLKLIIGGKKDEARS